MPTRASRHVHPGVEFNKNDAAELGQIDLIVTKEVSRFTRNTVDALQITVTCVGGA